MVIGVIFGFILLLIAMGINSLIGVPVWVIFVALLLVVPVWIVIDVVFEPTMRNERSKRR